MANDMIKTEAPPAEVARRMAEYRRFSFEGRLPPPVVYHGSMQFCPWPGCGYRVAGIRFNLERLLPPECCDDALASWSQGPGLVARCPGCHQQGLFGLEEEQSVLAAGLHDVFALPDDWAPIVFIA